MLESTIQIMARIDALELQNPCSGSRRIVDYLAREGIAIQCETSCAAGFMCDQPDATHHHSRRPTARFSCLVGLRLVTVVDQIWAFDIS